MWWVGSYPNNLSSAVLNPCLLFVNFPIKLIIIASNISINPTYFFEQLLPNNLCEIALNMQMISCIIFWIAMISYHNDDIRRIYDACFVD